MHKIILFFMIICCALLFLTACISHKESHSGTHKEYPYEPVELDFSHSIIRTYGRDYKSKNPQIPKTFLTYKAFNRYINKNWAFSGTFDSNGEPFPSYAERFKRPKEFFDDNLIVAFLIAEGSGSISHSLDSIYDNGSINITRFSPPLQSGDYALWFVIIELSKEHAPKQFELNMSQEVLCTVS